MNECEHPKRHQHNADGSCIQKKYIAWVWRPAWFYVDADSLKEAKAKVALATDGMDTTDDPAVTTGCGVDVHKVELYDEGDAELTPQDIKDERKNDREHRRKPNA